MAQLTSIIGYVDNLLQPKLFNDSALNGLQVDAGEGTIRIVAYAVDAGLSVIERAIAEEAQLLIVHHGLFWGKVHPISGAFGEKIKILLKQRCSLYASHLPLDASLEVGNGVELARFFGLKQIEGFCEYNGKMVGAKGILEKPVELEYFTERAAGMVGLAGPLVLPFGNREIRRVGIVTGSGAFAITPCQQEGLDLLISGEPKQEVYHQARELHMNALFLGHYATEIFGVRALAQRLEENFDVRTFFINEPTGI